MSLLDALLLDPAPFATFIAYRIDGIKGSGTRSDPFDGSTKYASALGISGITNIGADSLEANVTTPDAHNLSDGDAVTIDGVTGDGSAQWNGTFIIYGTTSNGFKYYMVRLPAAAAAGAMTASKVLAYGLDKILKTLPANSAIHLGPTSSDRPFLTQGYSEDSSDGWEPKAGMKIHGSGIDVTAIRLVAREISDAHFFAIGHTLGAGGSTAPNSMDFLEVTDLTIDCNLMLRPSSAVVCGAIRLMGNHARVRRVKATNWGTKSTSTPAFVIAMITADPPSNAYDIEDAGIENCIAVEPAVSVSGGKMAILHAGGTESAITAAEAYGTGPHIRNCHVDCGTLTSDPEYRALSMGWCRAGVIEGNLVLNAACGGPCQERASIRDIIVRRNVYRNVIKGPFWDLGVLEPGSPESLSNLARETLYPSIAIAQTSSEHFLQAGERVRIGTSGGSPGFSGIFVVKDVQPPNQFRYQMTADAMSNPLSATVQKVLGVTRLLVERNTIELASDAEDAVGVFVHDNNDGGSIAGAPDYMHGEVIIRNNKIRYVNDAPPDDEGVVLIQVNGAKNVIVQKNRLDTISAAPIVAHRCGSESYFDNRTAEAELLAISDHTANDFAERLEIPAEDALTMACFDAS